MEGVRQRMTSAKSKFDQFSNAYERERANLSKTPETTDRAFNIAQISETAGPFFVFLAGILEKVEPIADVVSNALSTAWTALQPYHPEDLFVALYGFFLVFFGGVYMTLIASLEAAHLFGWDRIKVAFAALYVEWVRARAAFERDNKVPFCHPYLFSLYTLHIHTALPPSLTPPSTISLSFPSRSTLITMA